jgi:hypothetical protein
MKILLIGDLHLRSLSDRPKWRLDNHYESQFQELSEIRDIAAAHKVGKTEELGKVEQQYQEAKGQYTEMLKANGTCPMCGVSTI